MISRVLVSPRVSHPDIVPLVGQDKGRALVRVVHQPGVRGIDDAVLEEDHGAGLVLEGGAEDPVDGQPVIVVGSDAVFFKAVAVGFGDPFDGFDFVQELDGLVLREGQAEEEQDESYFNHYIE